MVDGVRAWQADASHWGCITQVMGIEAGHCTEPRRPTGCTVLIARDGAVAGVDVRGAAPGTRETDLLDPCHTVERVHAVALCGGSAWGLDAASGVMQWLEEQQIGLDVGVARVPIVPAAVLFDLLVGDPGIRPGAAHGYAACQQAGKEPLACGSVGAGTGATVGKVFGLPYAMRGGIGSASLTLQGVTVAAVIACNALGDVIHPATGSIVAGARSDVGGSVGESVFRHTHQALLRGEPPVSILAGSNTTIGAVVTDAVLSKPQAQRLATVAHDGLARAISPVHTPSDGDTLFALATGQVPRHPGILTLSAMATEVVVRATLRAVWNATSYRDETGLYLPAAADWHSGRNG